MDFYVNGSLVSSSALVPSFTNNLNSLQFRRGDGQFGADFFGAVINGVTSISSDNALTSNPNEFYKIAIRYQSGNSAIYINGTSVLTTTTTFSSGNFTALDFNHWNNSLNFFGKTKALAVWKEALSDSELTIFNNNIMNIYKTNFPTEQEGKDYLLSIGVLVETDNEIVFSKDTAAVVYIGKVVKIPATYDA